MSRTTQVMLSVLMLVMMTTKAWSQKTMVVLSDTHVMGPGLLVSEGEAWESYLDNDRKLVVAGTDLGYTQAESVPMTSLPMS